MTDKPKSKFYFVRESFAESLWSDAATFLFLVGSVWFNQKYCGGSYFLNGVILVLFIIFLVGKANCKGKREGVFYSKAELIAHLQKSE